MKKIVSLSLSFIMLASLTACGQDIPELNKPSWELDAYYTVTKGDFCDTKVLDGFVAPVTSDVYFTASGQAYEVLYQVGDEVKAGDPIIYLNENSDIEISDVEDEIKRYEDLTEYYLSSQKKEIDEMNNTLASMSGMQKELYALDIRTKEAENALSNYNRENEYAKLKEKYDKLVADSLGSTIKAPCDGIITYLGAEKAEDDVSSGSLALTVADTSKKYVQFAGEYSQTDIDNFDQFYIKIGDDKISLVEVFNEDTLDENVLAITDNYTYVYSDDIESYEFGTYCAVYMISNENKSCLYVPTECIYSEKDGSHYCLLMGEEGDLKASVEIGNFSESYVEVKSGLNEGDMVYYGNNLVLFGSEYEFVEVTTGDYIHSISYPEAFRHAVDPVPVRAPFDGEIVDVYLDRTTNTPVSEGDKIFSVTMDVTDSKYQQAELDLSNLETSYDGVLAGYQDAIDSKKKEIEQYTSDAEIAIAKYELTQCELSYDLKKEELDNDIAKLKQKIEYMDICKEGGAIDVVAPCDGVFDFVLNTTLPDPPNLVSGKSVSTRDDLGNIAVATKCNVKVGDFEATKKSRGNVPFGAKLTVTSKMDGVTNEVTGTAITTKNVLGLNWDKDMNIVIDLENREDCNLVYSANASVSYNDIEVKDVLLVSKKAIYYPYNDANDIPVPCVYLKMGDYVISRQVELGTLSILDDEYVWVKSGLNAGDQVAINF